ncbi:hypothetical protein PybrP1_000808 [[Pythium] brassicae (nom. inval.)]|nr:hypothetical protein PybrP1_000808 [[Pythium] brassicae (nom. inval.)]
MGGRAVTAKDVQLTREFEYKALALDRETLNKWLSKLQRRLHEGDESDSFEGRQQEPNC